VYVCVCVCVHAHRNHQNTSNVKVCKWMCDMTHSYQELYASSICHTYHELYESFKYYELNMNVSLDSFVSRTLCVIEISRTQHGSIEVSNILQMWRHDESFMCHSNHELYASFELHELNMGASNLEKTSIHHMRSYNESFTCHSHHELYESFEYHELNMNVSK